MGKIGGGSWLSAVKRAFRSPTKESKKRNSTKRREDHEQEEEEKKRGKRRWIFRKPSKDHETVIHHCEARTTNTTTTTTATTVTNYNSAATPGDAIAVMTTPSDEATDAKQRHALAVAIATTAAAQAAVATAQAAVEVVRLTRPSSLFAKRHFAAIAIQTAFRGYLARRALRALKGLVKLQALVRGHNVRKRAKTTLQCMQSLVRVQTRVREQRRRLSYEGSSNSINSSPKCLRGSLLAQIMSTSRDEVSSRSGGDDWGGVHWDDRHAQALEEIQSMLRAETKEVSSLRRENALANAFSHKMWRPGGRDALYASEGEAEENARWVDKWRTRKEWEMSCSSNRGRASYDHRSSDDPIKTVEIDTCRPYNSISYSSNPKPHNYQYQQQRPSSYSVASPIQRSHNKYCHSSSVVLLQSPAVTPSPSKLRSSTTTLLQVNSASPRCLREDYRRNQLHGSTNYAPAAAASSVVLPNYMVATESAKARIRSQSAPRQRPATPEREKTTAKKRLAFPVPPDTDDPRTNINCNNINGINSGGNVIITDYNLRPRSPAYNNKGVLEGDYLGMESNISSCCTDSIGDHEVSPPSTNDLSRWLR